jgi:putative flippase GtrA
MQALEPGDGTPLPAGAPCVEIVVPVYNEAANLDASVRTLRKYLTDHFPFTWRITIVDNASTDGTWFRAARLAREVEHVHARHLDRKGRGLALRTAWSASDAQVVAYMDVDLSTGLDALLPLVAPLVSGHSDLAIGSRLSSGASVARRPKRELISRGYNAILRGAFATRVRDAQCGFKAMRADVARRLLPHIEDDAWFFDTELLLLAEHNGLRIHQVPVDWIDDADSRVQIAQTARDDLRGTARMLCRFASGRGDVDLGSFARSGVVDDLGRRFVTFATIGAASTAISLALFLLLRAPIGAIPANAVAVTATFLGNTWAHARFTARHRRPRWRRAFAVYAGSLALTSAALGCVLAAGAGSAVQLLTLIATWSLATVVRFLGLGARRGHISPTAKESVR